MNIVIHKKERSTLSAFAEKHALMMVINERTPRDLGERWDENSRYYAYFKGCEVKNGAILIGMFGSGSTPTAAMEDYAKKISGQKLVLNAYKKDRVEINTPILSYI